MSPAAPAAIAWLDDAGTTAWGDPLWAPGASLPPGRWGRPQELALPLADRGLLLADGLFETLWLEDGRPQLLEPHLRRWRASAALLGMAPPPTACQLLGLLKAAVHRSGIRRGALRLNWSRGEGQGGRGIDLAAAGQETAPHRFWLQLSAAAPLFTAVSVLISGGERRNAASQLSRCKTFAYGAAIQARREAQRAGVDEALLLDGAGRLSCGSCANLLLRRDGCWLTPDLGSGCLPGVMRGRGLERGLLREMPLWPADLEQAEAALLINSLSCRPIRSWRQRSWAPAPAGTAADAETLWRSLLEERSPA